MGPRKEEGKIQKKSEEFLQIFRKGEEFTQELLKENERLRFKLVELEEELKERGKNRVKFLEERSRILEKEKKEIQERYRQVEAENKDFAAKYLDVEEENNNLANLYVASYQLHSTLDFNEVLRTVIEIVSNLIGAERFAIMIVDETTEELKVIASEGLNKEDIPKVKSGEGIIGEVVITGESYFEEFVPGRTSKDLSKPVVCIPLKIKEKVIGVIAIYSLLIQKKGFINVDYELFNLLVGHTATAIFSSKLYTQSEGKLTTIQAFIDLLNEKPL